MYIPLNNQMKRTKYQAKMEKLSSSDQYETYKTFSCPQCHHRFTTKIGRVVVGTGTLTVSVK